MVSEIVNNEKVIVLEPTNSKPTSNDSIFSDNLVGFSQDDLIDHSFYIFDAHYNNVPHPNYYGWKFASKFLNQNIKILVLFTYLPNGMQETGACWLSKKKIFELKNRIIILQNTEIPFIDLFSELNEQFPVLNEEITINMHH